MLNNDLKNTSYLVGERITYADIAVACELLLPLKLVIEPTTLANYPHLKRWFLTIVNQPEMKKYVGEYVFCVKPQGFDSKRYNELHPKDEKPKKTEAAPVVQAPPAKKKDLFPNFESKFNLEDFKRVEANSNPMNITIPYLWENFDKEKYSIWFTEYKYAGEQSMGFLVKNFIRGTFDGLQSLSKHMFGILYILGEGKPYKVQGIYIQKGQDLIFNLDHDALFDCEIFDFKKLDVDSAEDKKVAETFLSKADKLNDTVVYDYLFLR